MWILDFVQALTAVDFLRWALRGVVSGIVTIALKVLWDNFVQGRRGSRKHASDKVRIGWREGLRAWTEDITGPASLSDIPERGDAPKDDAGPSRHRGRTSSNTNSEAGPADSNDELIVVGVLALVAMTLYLEYRAEALQGLAAAAAFSLGLVFTLLLYVRARRVILEAPVVALLLALGAVNVAGILCISFLIDPPFYGGEVPFDRLMSRASRRGIPALLEGNAKPLAFVAYQVLGLLVAFAMVVATAIQTSSVFALINEHTGLWPRVLWRRWARVGDRPFRLLLLNAVLCVIAVALCSGFLANAVLAQQWSLPSGN